MKKETFALLTILLMFVIVFSTPLVLANGDDNSGSNDSDKEDGAREGIINAIVSGDENDDEANDDDDEKEDEIEIEIETKDGRQKIKVKSKGVNASQIREALQERNRLRVYANGTELPENCTQTGSAIKCQVQEKLRTRAEIRNEGVEISNELRNKVNQLKESFENLTIEFEVEIKAEVEDGEVELESETEGTLTSEQQTLVEEIEAEILSLLSGISEEAEIEVKVRHQYERERVMTIMAGQSGNTIIQSKGINASTQVQLYHHNGEVYGLLSGNETRLIEFLPDEVRERVRERIHAKIEGNETMELGEEGEYEIRVRKEARFLGLFKVREKLELHVDSETGEILKERAPWWGFLANDVEAESVNETE